MSSTLLKTKEINLMNDALAKSILRSEEARKFGEFLSLKVTIEELKEKYRKDEKYMDIAKKVEEFMRDRHLVQYYDLEASHQFEIKDSYDTGKNEEKISIAKNLLNLNIDIPTIMKSTGLSKQEIKNLSKSI